MNLKRRSSLWGAVISIVIIAFLFSTTLYTYNKNVELKEINEALNADINKKIQIVENLQVKIEDLQTENETLSQNIDQITQEKTLIEQEKNNLENENQSLKVQLEEALSSKKPSNEQPGRRDFKSYMYYTAITSKSSKQWALQKRATTNEDGFRCIDGIPMVAVGTGWGLSVGDKALVICENGNSFQVIIGDIKSNAHTDNENKTTLSNGCRCEFIVDKNSLNSTIKKLGNVAVLEKYSGYIIDIKKSNY